MKIDERVSFYLENEKLIRQWSKLKFDLFQEATKFYKQIADDFEDWVQETFDDPPEIYSKDGKYDSKLFLTKQHWNFSSKGKPLLGIGIEWPRKATFTNSTLGLWINLTSTISKPWRDDLVQKLKTDLVDQRIKRGKHWPIRLNPKPSRKDYWNDLESFRAELLDQINDIWLKVHPLVDEFIDLKQKEQ